MRPETAGIVATDFAVERQQMVERQLRNRGLADPQILDAFNAVPRELFVDQAQAELAYGDHPLPIAAGQTISQPYIVALMMDAAGIRRGDRVLEVGAGSGYAAAVISRIAGRVIGVERQHDLVEAARERLARLAYENVEIVEADGTIGWPAEAPYEAILVSASGSHVPSALVNQLSPGGRLVMPVGAPGTVQQLVAVTRDHDGNVKQWDLGAVRFVPLIGQEGWDEA